MSESVVVIGNFDGVHPGHLEVLRRAHEEEPDLPLVVVTFWPHPASVVRPGQAPMLLTSLRERVELLRHAGADDVHVINFTPEFARHTPEEFLTDVVLPLHPRRVVVGVNFRFGHRASGTVETLRQFGAKHGFEVTALELVAFGDEETCSSRIREALARGDVGHAAEHLGRPFRFLGTVRHGDHRGRALGFPTANLAVPAEQASPADGVYAGWLTRLDGCDAWGVDLPRGQAPQRWPAAISVGSNPTFDGAERRVESYVLDRDDLELYGAEVAVDFEARIRGQVKFGGVDSLIEQMRRDVEQTRSLLRRAENARPTSP